LDSSAQSLVEAYWEIVRRSARWTLILAIIAGLIYCVYRIRSVVLFVFLAVILTYVLLPGVDWLCRNRNRRLSPKVQRLIATILVFLVFLSLVAAVISLFARPFSTELGEFTTFIKDNFGKYVGQLPTFLTQIAKTFRLNVDVQEFLSKPDLSKLGGVVSQLGTWTVHVASSSIRVALDVFLIPVLAFYFVFDYRSITRELYSLVPTAKRREAVRMGRCVGELLQSYIFGQLILCVIAGVLTGVFLGLLHIKYALVLAIFAGITRAIPVIGPIVSGIPIIIIGALTAKPTSSPIETAVVLAIFVTVMHFSESKFIMPQLIGRRMRLHPAVVVIVLLIGAEFFGLVGMFIAAPVAAIARELIMRYYINPRQRRFCVPAVPRNR